MEPARVNDPRRIYASMNGLHRGSTGSVVGVKYWRRGWGYSYKMANVRSLKTVPMYNSWRTESSNRPNLTSLGLQVVVGGRDVAAGGAGAGRRPDWNRWQGAQGKFHRWSDVYKHFWVLRGCTKSWGMRLIASWSLLQRQEAVAVGICAFLLQNSCWNLMTSWRMPCSGLVAFVVVSLRGCWVLNDGWLGGLWHMAVARGF